MQRTAHFPQAFTAFVIAALLASCDVPRREEKSQPAADLPQTARSIFTIIEDSDTTAFYGWLNERDLVDVKDEATGDTPLIFAARLGRISYVQELLGKRADPDLTDLAGRTALHAAAASNHLAIVRFLLEAGANPSIADAEGLTPADLAQRAGKAECAALLKDALEQFLANRSVRAPEPEVPAEAPPEAVLLSTDFRFWTSASGDRIEAAYIQSVFDTAVLQKRDGSMVRIGIHRLSSSDQVAIRQLQGIDPHVLAGARAVRAPAASSGSSRRGASLGMRIGQGNGWTVLTDCRFLKNSANDGDSFHVKHEGKEYIFRLYFVDAAETSMEFPDRVEAQASYFGLTDDAAMKVGHEAARFTTSLLASSPFTVLTKWEDARGNSSLPRYYALVVTPMGDLDELLTREGLVRQYGMHIDGGAARKKESELNKLEDDARRDQAGAWGKTDGKRAARTIFD